MTNKNTTIFKYSLIIFVVVSSILLYFYLPLTEAQQREAAHEILSNELYSVDVEPKRFKGPKKVITDGQVYFQWTFDDDTDYLIARVNPINRRIDSVKQSNIIYRSSSNHAWEKVKEYYKANNTKK